MTINVLYEQSNRYPLSNYVNAQLLSTFGKTPGLHLHEVHLAGSLPCSGCSSCWLKTPGSCILKIDEAHQLVPLFRTSELVIIISSIRYGAYSSTIKYILDRMSPNLLPFLIPKHHDFHYLNRYNKMASWIVLGYADDLTPEEMQTFKETVASNALHFNIPHHQVFFGTSPQEVDTALSAILKLLLSLK